MKITPEIIFYLFSQKYPLSYPLYTGYDCDISSVCLYDKTDELKAGILYVISPEDYASLKDKSGSIFIISGAAADAEPENARAATATGFTSAHALYTALLDVFNTFLKQENFLLLAAMDPSRAVDVYSFGKNWFPWEYSIVDIDMKFIYATEDLPAATGSDVRGDGIPRESIHSLILSRKFHDAANYRHFFYEPLEFNNLLAVCRNIMPDRQYAGRTVMFLDEGTKRIPPGAEELFEFYTDCITESLRRSGHFVSRRQNDPLHLLCRSVLQGDKVQAHSAGNVFRRYGWADDHLFSVIILHFLSDSAWEVQLETTLPYIADELESEWPHSCAVNTGTELRWVLNLTLSGADINLHSFHQRVACFVREYSCSAGVSSVFKGFSFLADAARIAAAALDIGQQKNPHFWYHLFDDYRLDFVKESLRSSAPVEFLTHPAIQVLRKFDEENGSELSSTLKAYLENGRNMSAAADAIFIHRTTFCRRMDAIKKITGIDPDDLETTLLLELSYQFSS